MKNNLFVSLGSFILAFGFSHLSLGQEIEVTLKNSAIGSSFVSVEFSNNSETTAYLLKYNFCGNGILFDDLFKIQKESGASEEDVGHYGGVVDFVGRPPYSKKYYLEIPPNTKISCTVDILQDYAVLEQGIYNIIYQKKSPSAGSVNGIELTSNKLKIELSPRLHNAEIKSSKQ